jgi:signal transduction histidine kinase
MYGRVWCERAPGRGATFVLELPVVHGSTMREPRS